MQETNTCPHSLVTHQGGAHPCAGGIGLDLTQPQEEPLQRMDHGSPTPSEFSTLLKMIGRRPRRDDDEAPSADEGDGGRPRRDDDEPPSADGVEDDVGPGRQCRQGEAINCWVHTLLQVEAGPASLAAVHIKLLDGCHCCRIAMAHVHTRWRMSRLRLKGAGRHMVQGRFQQRWGGLRLQRPRTTPTVWCITCAAGLAGYRSPWSANVMPLLHPIHQLQGSSRQVWFSVR